MILLVLHYWHHTSSAKRDFEGEQNQKQHPAYGIPHFSMEETDSSELPIYLDRNAFNLPGTDQIGPEDWNIKLDDHLDLLDSSDSDHLSWMFEVFPPLLACSSVVT